MFHSIVEIENFVAQYIEGGFYIQLGARCVRVSDDDADAIISRVIYGNGHGAHILCELASAFFARFWAKRWPLSASSAPDAILTCDQSPLALTKPRSIMLYEGARFLFLLVLFHLISLEKIAITDFQYFP